MGAHEAASTSTTCGTSGGGGGSTIPTLTVLDNFDRALADGFTWKYLMLVSAGHMAPPTACPCCSTPASAPAPT